MRRSGLIAGWWPERIDDHHRARNGAHDPAAPGARPRLPGYGSGAVLTQEYADEIGADFYGKDAMASVRFAQQLFSV
mgnify:CR=1 FL=1